jgi:RNA polymerase sigma-70 factor (ECF subfamily)
MGNFIPPSNVKTTDRVQVTDRKRIVEKSFELRTDEYLVEAAQAGNSGAFGALVERYQDRLYNTLTRVLGSRDDASEVLQDAFVLAYTKLGSFRGNSRFYTWLYRVALNQACSHRRRTSRRRGELSVEQLRELSGTEPVDASLQPEQILVRTEQAELVQLALTEISDEHREILVLREMEDYSYETIAEILELPVGTVRSRLFRARLQLKERLELRLSTEHTEVTE